MITQLTLVIIYRMQKCKPKRQLRTDRKIHINYSDVKQVLSCLKSALSLLFGQLLQVVIIKKNNILESVSWLCYDSISWWRHQMETFSELLALCSGNSPVTGEFPAQRPVTRSFDVFFDLRPNKRLSKQSWGLWFETPSRWLWRHCNILTPHRLLLITTILHTGIQWSSGALDIYSKGSKNIWNKNRICVAGPSNQLFNSGLILWA